MTQKQSSTYIQMEEKIASMKHDSLLLWPKVFIAGRVQGILST